MLIEYTSGSADRRSNISCQKSASLLLWITIAAFAASASVLAVLTFLRSVVLGLFGGAIVCGALAFSTTGAGSGDMTELAEVFFAAVFGVIGAIAGAVGAGVAKAAENARRDGA